MNKTVVTRAIEEVWNTGAVDVLDQLLSADYVRHGRAHDTDRAALKETILLSRNAFPDLHTRIEHIVADGDLVATHWRSVGTHCGAFHDLPITGKTVTVTGHTMSRMVDGRIAEEWESWDGADFFAGLGVVDLWGAS